MLSQSPPKKITPQDQALPKNKGVTASKIKQTYLYDKIIHKISKINPLQVLMPLIDNTDTHSLARSSRNFYQLLSNGRAQQLFSIRKTQLSVAIAGNFTRIISTLFPQEENLSALKQLIDQELARKLALINNMKPGGSITDLANQMRFIANPEIEHTSELLTIDSAVTASEEKLIRDSKLNALSPLPNSDTLDEFLQAIETARRKCCFPVTPPSRPFSCLDKVILSTSPLFIPPIVPASYFIGPLQNEWNHQRSILANITTPCPSRPTCADYSLGSFLPCGTRETGGEGPRLGDDCLTGIIDICQAACHELGVISGEWGGALAGVVIGAVLLFALALLIQKRNYCAYIRPSEDLFNQSSITQLSRGCIEAAENMFNEYRNTTMFINRNTTRSPIGNVVRIAKQELIRANLRLFRPNDNYKIDIVAASVNSSSSNVVVNQNTPLLGGKRRT